MRDLLRLFALALQDREFYALVMFAAFQYVALFATQRELLRRMDSERRARSWNALSWSAAILWTGGLSMIPFAWVTRPARGPRAGAIALVVGTAWAIALNALFLGFGYVVERAFGVTFDA